MKPIKGLVALLSIFLFAIAIAIPAYAVDVSPDTATAVVTNEAPTAPNIVTETAPAATAAPVEERQRMQGYSVDEPALTYIQVERPLLVQPPLVVLSRGHPPSRV